MYRITLCLMGNVVKKSTDLLCTDKQRKKSCMQEQVPYPQKKNTDDSLFQILSLSCIAFSSLFSSNHFSSSTLFKFLYIHISFLSFFFPLLQFFYPFFLPSSLLISSIFNFSLSHILVFLFSYSFFILSSMFCCCC